MQDCVFCKIVVGEIEAKKVSETPNLLAFYDKNPAADTHILVIPKTHIATFLEIKKEDVGLQSEITKLIQTIIVEKKIEGKYKVVINGGDNQVVPHLHWHILGGNPKREL